LADMSFWYLVQHLGRRFLADLPRYLPDVQQVAQGVWQAHVFTHPVRLVSVSDVLVERDSLLFPVLGGVPAEQRPIILDVLRAEPALWPSYGPWLAHREPALWQEILRMATEQNQLFKLDFAPLVEYMLQTGDRAGIKTLMETLGIKEAVEMIGE